MLNDSNSPLLNGNHHLNKFDLLFLILTNTDMQIKLLFELSGVTAVTLI